ncbi:MAG: 30S ribosomal protein S3 [Alphaproteobacteria bacterium]|jgi:small subunit ribosomal protein S3|nr:30S ribosomal protein S3 [Alphaproteobacteria bacterium]
MGQKVKPIGLRLGINRTWDSRWFASRDYGSLLIEDLKLREYILKKLSAAGISKVVIERPAKKVIVTVYSARPGIIIGKKGADIEKLKQDLSKRVSGDFSLNVVEIRKPELDAQLVAENIAQQIERRGSYRRAMKRAMQSTLKMGAQGMRVAVSGRLGGAEIARVEEYREGRVPLHTLRADIDYGFAGAHTTYGVTGIKVWIFRGEIMAHDPMATEKRSVARQASR